MTGESPHQTGEPPRQGLLDTNILVLRRWVDPTELPDEMAISAITLAELSAGPHHPLYTTNPGDYAGLEKLVRVVPVTRPPLRHDKRPDRG